MIDFLFGFATLLFCITVFIQIHKNYKIKKITSQSMLWHICSFFGLILILIGHGIGGYCFAFVITIINLVERLILIIQIKIYWVDV